MAKNEQPREMPVWFDGKSINEALFCDDFLSRHKIIYTDGAFFTPDGRIANDLPLRGEIFEELKCCAVSNIPRKISNIVELMKLAALVEDFPPEQDCIHNGQGQRHHQRPQRLGHRTGQAEVHPRLAPERDNSQRGNSEDRERAAGGNDKRINIDRGGHSIDACKQMRGENENYFTDIA